MRKPRTGPTEEEVRIALCLALAQNGFVVTAERRIPGQRQRYDIGLHMASTDELPYGLLEVKKRPRARLPARSSRQRSAYEASRIPYRYCCGMDGIERAVRWAICLREHRNRATL